MNIQERIAHLEEEKRHLQDRNRFFNVYTNSFKARERRVQAIDKELAGLYQKVS